MSKTCFDIDLANVRTLEHTDRNKDVLEPETIAGLSLIPLLLILTKELKKIRRHKTYSYIKYRKTTCVYWHVHKGTTT